MIKSIILNCLRNSRFNVLAFITVLTLTGCQSVPKINVDVDPYYKDTSLQVDLVGVNSSQYEVWSEKSVNEYFTPGDNFRQSADKKTLNFGENRPPLQTLPTGDPIWNGWKKNDISHIFVLVNLPGISDEQVDKRRQVIPLEPQAWKSSALSLNSVPNEIKVNVAPTGVRLVPSPE